MASTDRGESDARAEHYAATVQLYATELIATADRSMGHLQQLAGIDGERAREAGLVRVSVRRTMLELLVPEVPVLRRLLDEADRIGRENAPALPEPNGLLEREIVARSSAAYQPAPGGSRSAQGGPRPRTLLNGSLEVPVASGGPPPSVFSPEAEEALEELESDVPFTVLEAEWPTASDGAP